MTGVTAIGAAVATQGTGKAQSTPAAQTTPGDNPELEPLRTLLTAYDTAFANHDLSGVIALLAEKAVIMGTGPGEIWSGPEAIKSAYQHFFENFEYGSLTFSYEFSLGEVNADAGCAYLVRSGNVDGKVGEREFEFPMNLSLVASKENGKWLIKMLHFSTLTGLNAEES